MKKRKINKTRLKIFIALTLMFTLITTIYIGTKTFAYESDKISYTISQLSDDEFENNIVNIDNNNSYVDIDFGTTLYVKGINNFNSNGNQYYLLINYTYLNANNETYYQHSSSYNQINPSIKRENNTYISSNYVRINNNAFNYNGTYYTQIIPFNYNTYYSDFTNYARFISLGGHLRIYNIDMVTSAEIGLSQYYDTYYSQIEDNYNQLLDDYENLQDDYSQLEHDYSDLEDDYNELETNYNRTEQNYNNINQVYKYSFMAFMENGYIENNETHGTHFEIFYTDTTTQENLWEDIPISLNYITQFNNGISYNIYEMANDIIDNYSNIDFTHAYINSINLNIMLQEPIDINYIDFTLKELHYDMEIFIGNLTQNNQLIYLTASQANNTQINSEFIQNENQNIKQVNYISISEISYDSDFDKPIMTINNTSTAYYSNGYNNGFTNGRNSINNEIERLNNTINTLNNQVNTQQQTINALNEQIRAFNTDYNLNNLMWTIAGTPFESFKQIWNVKFFGVNVSELLLGLITTFIALNIAKRFFF